jgi:hypothetical protein
MIDNGSKSWQMRLVVTEFQKTKRFIFPGTQRDLFYIFLLNKRLNREKKGGGGA